MGKKRCTIRIRKQEEKVKRESIHDVQVLIGPKSHSKIDDFIPENFLILALISKKRSRTGIIWMSHFSSTARSEGLLRIFVLLSWRISLEFICLVEGPVLMGT